MIAVRNISKSFHEAGKVLDAFSLEVKAGESVGIMGGNGSGKSTLLKILSGVYQPDTGEVECDGKLAAVLELGSAFDLELSAVENVILQGVLMGVPRKEMLGKVSRVLKYAGLEEFAEMKLKHFSSGMRSRLAFAIIREVPADVYLFDEVMAVGDESFRAQCLQQIQEWRDLGKTMIMVSHDRGLLEQVCDRIVSI